MATLNFNTDSSEMKVLIVDDIPLNVLLIQEMLSPFNFKLFKAGNGQTALDIIEKEQPDLVLLDLMMPGMSGYDVLKTVRETKDMNTLPIVILSALNSNDDVVKGFSLGANDFITKPVIMQRLHNCVTTQLNLLLAHRHLNA